MIRISANVAKKVPIDNIDFTSQQFGASMEVEVSDADNSDAIQAKIRRLYELLSGSVDEQIFNAREAGNGGTQKARLGEPRAAFLESDASGRQSGNGNGNGSTNRNGPARGNGNGKSSSRRVTATAAQVRAVYGICKDLCVPVEDVCADYNVAKPDDLHVRDASRLIDDLKARRNGAGSRQ